MNVVEHRSLWSAIQQFPLDEPNAAIPFSKKLAAEQKWSTAFTQKAIEEYRKFIFLCCISPNGASPSKIVDEVWHLHLTYTQSYWTKFCKETLGKDIHHHPSRGGEGEDHKHGQWYRQTLVLYQQVFESPPPKEIWPPPVDESPPRIKFVPDRTPAFITALLLSIPLVATGYFSTTFNPFSLSGPQFLVFFSLLTLCSIACYVIRQNKTNQAVTALVHRHFPSDANVYQLAQFLYGKHRAVQTAIIDLLRRKLLHVSGKRFVLHKGNYPLLRDEINPLIEGFLKEDDLLVDYDRIAFEWYYRDAVTHPALEFLYTCAYEPLNFLKRFNFLWLPLVMGVSRKIQELGDERLASNLTAFMVGALIVCAIVESEYSQKMLLFKRVREIVMRKHECFSLYPDRVVSEFALQGTDATDFYNEGWRLKTIFEEYPVLQHSGTKRRETDSDGSCSSCSSCNSGD